MHKIFFITTVLMLGLSYQSVAQGGDLVVTPKRVVFEGQKQNQELSLINIGNDTATYSISFVQRNMREDGSFVTIEKPDSGQMFADPYLRIFPRTITLAPGEAQVVMLQNRRSADMKPGEYRSHLYFRSEKNYTALGMDNQAKDSTLVSVQLIPVFGISIPTIIHVGEVSVSAYLSDLKLEMKQDSLSFLKLTINRTGNISIYGNLTVEFIPLHGKSHIIAKSNGVSIYTNINKRTISIKLNKTPGMTLTGGKLKVSYTNRPEEGNKVIYAEKELDV